ncbi:MAG: ABC transporter permease [Desulfovibrio sp.]|uniref:ABC transporter permease n=1 Tax=Desulfovibrio sp. 7SRBS1 TaxID=3378064 RepID=UPI003B3E5F2C
MRHLQPFSRKRVRRSPVIRRLTGAGIFLLGPFLLWQVSAQFFPPLVVASPAQTLDALWRLLCSPDFLNGQLLISLGRIAMGLGMAIIAGICLGIAAGLYRPVRLILEPFRWIFTSIPAVVVVMVAMLWFGMGTRMVVSIAATMLTPIIYVGVVEGMAAMDKELLEMAAVYRFSTAMRIRHIQLMAIAAPLVSSLVIATGNSVRIVILAEVLGAIQGLGRGLAEARTNLDTPQLYAYVLLSLLIVGLVESGIVRPLQRFSEKWRI